jgi:hypothetical protein
MARIKCRTPSTGKPLSITKQNVSTSYETIVEAPDFSVPDPSGTIAAQPEFVVDPTDSSRAIRPGEVFFLSPLSARNKDSVTRWVETQLVKEDGTTINFGRVEVRAGDTAFIPLQGRSLFKRDASSSFGDRMQVRAETSDSFDVWSVAEEKLTAEHIGTEEV